MGQVTFFLGANTPAGFYSLYDQMLEPAQTRRVFLLKGGAGCGKSTLMGQVAERLEQAGERVEYIRCSGDPDSLDAVIFPDLGAAVVDATAPHVMEPKMAGIVESYVNLGQLYDHAALAPLREEAERAMESSKAHYQRAYRCLTAAAQLAEDDRALLTTPALEAKARKRAMGILSREVKKTGRAAGAVSRRFLSAVTCQGVLCRFDTADALCRKVYELRDSYGLANEMLSVLASGALAAGYDVILCPSPLFPERTEHLLIPQLSLAFLTSTAGREYPARPYRRVRLDAMVENDTLRKYKARLKFSRRVYSALMEEAVEALAQAKSAHDRLEGLYNPHVDFEGVYAQGDAITEELLALREERS